MLLFEASQVNNRPLSERSRLSKITFDVTVDPEETSDDVLNPMPLWSHRTCGFGRPKDWKSKKAKTTEILNVNWLNRLNSMK